MHPGILLSELTAEVMRMEARGSGGIPHALWEDAAAAVAQIKDPRHKSVILAKYCLNHSEFRKIPTALCLATGMPHQSIAAIVALQEIFPRICPACRQQDSNCEVCGGDGIVRDDPLKNVTNKKQHKAMTKMVEEMRACLAAWESSGLATISDYLWQMS